MTYKEYTALLQISEQEAHRRLFDEYYRYVRTIVFNRLRSFSDEDVEECISDIFAEAFFNFRDENLTEDMKTVICTIARCRSIDHYRRHIRNAVRTVPIEDENVLTITADEDLPADNEKRELSRMLMDCIRSLGEPDSSIIIRKFYYNMDSKQIAGELAMKPSAVRMRCKRAAAKLKEVLASKGFGEGTL